MEPARRHEVLCAGALEVLPTDSIALAHGRPLTLSVREFEVLCVLASHPDRIVSRKDLYRLVWGGEIKPDDRSVDVYVRKLRVKLERALPDWRFIHTHPGFGYRLSAEPSEPHIRAEAGLRDSVASSERSSPRTTTKENT